MDKVGKLKDKLLKETGHEFLEPANQYCKHCGKALFIKENSREVCPKNPPNG